MAITFKAYEGAESTLTDLGTPKSLVGKNGSLGFIKKNFNDPNKRIVLLLKKQDGTSTTVTCSKSVTEGLRNGSLTLNHIADFKILENEEGSCFISMPEGSGGVQLFSVAKLKPMAFESNAEFIPEELIAL